MKLPNAALSVWSTLRLRAVGCMLAAGFLVGPAPAMSHDDRVHETRDTDRHVDSSLRGSSNGSRDASRPSSASDAARQSSHADSGKTDAASVSGSNGGSTATSSTSGSSGSASSGGSPDGSSGGSSGGGKATEISGSNSSGNGSSEGGSSGSGTSGSGSSGSGSSGSGDSSGEGSGGNQGSDHGGDSMQSAQLEGGRSSGARIQIERGADGRERRRNEVLMIGRAETIAQARAAGFVVLSEKPLPAFGESVARIGLGPGSSVDEAVLQLQALAPSASIAPNHVYRPSQAFTSNTGASTLVPAAAIVRPQVATVALGMIDTGVDGSRAALLPVITRTQSFSGNAYAPRLHGTMVAEIAAAGGARLTVADVFGPDDDNRLVAPADAIASAMAWLASEHVPVINISIEGPDNGVMAHVIQRAVAAGIVVVAAAGNSGPAAPAAFPAAYPGVIAVTAIDDQDRVYRRANRGDYIAFAAAGVNVIAVDGPADQMPVSGTSFASPVIAAAIAQRLARTPDVLSVVAQLQHEARDLGAAGRDPVFGWGAIGPGPRDAATAARVSSTAVPAVPAVR